MAIQNFTPQRITVYLNKVNKCYNFELMKNWMEENNASLGRARNKIAEYNARNTREGGWENLSATGRNRSQTTAANEESEEIREGLLGKKRH